MVFININIIVNTRPVNSDRNNNIISWLIFEPRDDQIPTKLGSILLSSMKNPSSSKIVFCTNISAQIQAKPSEILVWFRTVIWCYLSMDYSLYGKPVKTLPETALRSTVYPIKECYNCISRTRSSRIDIQTGYLHTIMRHCPCSCFVITVAIGTDRAEQERQNSAVRHSRVGVMVVFDVPCVMFCSTAQSTAS